jgi:cbb3-type cytochrome oxidase subunit 3
MLQGVITAVLMLLFIGSCIWLWRPQHSRELDAAARMPLNDDRKQTS